MRAGKLRHRVTIQQKSGNQDSFGGESWDNPTIVATVWAAVEPLQVRWKESVAGNQEIAEATTQIRMRFREGITTGMRAVHGSTTYDFEAAIDVDGRKRELILMCKAI